eukprot:3934132-Rhodomonas_salina.8
MAKDVTGWRGADQLVDEGVVEIELEQLSIGVFVQHHSACPHRRRPHVPPASARREQQIAASEMHRHKHAGINLTSHEKRETPGQCQCSNKLQRHWQKKSDVRASECDPGTCRHTDRRAQLRCGRGSCLRARQR